MDWKHFVEKNTQAITNRNRIIKGVRLYKKKQ